MDKLWYLSRISLFESLPPEDLEQIDKMAPMTHFNKLPKNTVIQQPDSTVEGLFIVKEGKVRLYKLNADGKQFTVGILGPGNMFGEVHFISLGTKGLYIETVEETLICSLTKNQFENFLLQRPKLAIKFLQILSDRLQEKEELLERIALGNLQDQVLYLLVKLADKFGIPSEGGMVKIDMPLTHQELANMIGATRESVTVVLHDLAKENIVITGRMNIQVHLSKAKEHLANKLDEV
ncbi:Crp/Fnr family transcriptional regulator [Paenibacillus sediminis]|uniref:CRP/FNR family transcriptional regulator n=1 Tax=Paenibacillus sediminis TaxID=664909 RepID=A0ABS4GYZ3_9BACL|nr:Crp/Fnr family transcriptional regulator [Paenibacillus sediminis]MBP1935493.1 CRP/FNR family transcriptional regulator [Paenibacillus sediminis]